MVFSFVVICGLTAPASAVPITYSGVLYNGVTTAGVNNQTPGNQSNPVGATYFGFFANAGDNVVLFGDRQAGHYDMSFWVLSGFYTDTTQIGGSFPGSASFSDFGDDEDPPNIPGPFGDPRSVFVAPTTGFYTVGVTNFLSGPGGPPNPFTLNLSGTTPEPTTLAVFGLMAVGAYGVRRRLKKATA
jgi:hypothetical protein